MPTLKRHKCRAPVTFHAVMNAVRPTGFGHPGAVKPAFETDHQFGSSLFSVEEALGRQT
jgi:hypothetical protein